MDIRVFHPNALSYENRSLEALYKDHERQKSCIQLQSEQNRGKPKAHLLLWSSQLLEGWVTNVEEHFSEQLVR